MRRKNLQSAFLEEEAKSQQFLQKLGQIQKKNKESKKRTIVNQHKLDWVNTMKTFLKREQTLDVELTKFLESNPHIKVAANSQRATLAVRDRLLTFSEKMAALESKFSSLKSDYSEPLAIEDEMEEEEKAEIARLEREIEAMNQRIEQE